MSDNDNTNILCIGIIVLCIIIIYIVHRYYIIDEESNVQKIINSIQSPLLTDISIRKLKSQIDSDINQIINQKINNLKLRKIALMSIDGGKRIRPIIAYSIINKMNSNVPLKRIKSVNAIEILHSASLMIDDMMDSDDTRRGKKSPHVIYGNDLTLLTAAQMIICAFNMISEIDMEYISQLISQNKKNIKNYKLIISKILQKTTKLIDGQTIDIENDIMNDRITVLDVLNKKTASIFEMIFLMSWIIGNGDPNKIKDIEEIAIHFGIMFQIYDDFTDIFKDNKKGFNLNYVLRFGFNTAINEFFDRKKLFINMMNKMDIMTHEILIITEYMTDVVLNISKEYNKN
jgi:geranylgeranyl diphosphate synthase type II